VKGAVSDGESDEIKEEGRLSKSKNPGIISALAFEVLKTSLQRLRVSSTLPPYLPKELQS